MLPVLLGIPCDINSSFLRGAAHAPERIRLMEREGSANVYTEDGQAIISGQSYQDLGNLTLGAHSQEIFTQISKSLADLVAQGRRILSLGGDHSITYPIIHAYRQYYADLHILQFDAHGDLYHDFGSNPWSHASPFARILEGHLTDSLTQVGIRSLTTHQREQISRFGVTTIEMKDWNMAFVEQLRGPLYISLDLDVLDPAHAPGVSHHEPGGCTTRQLLDVLHAIRVPIVGADIVEYNPIRDSYNLTAMTAYKLMKELLAKLIAR